MYDKLLSPLQIGNTVLKNRVLMGSMHTMLEELPKGFDRAAVFYAERARAQVALIVTGGISPNHAGRVAPISAKLSEKFEIKDHQKITRAVHREKGKICMQILHAGRYGYHPEIVAPSAIQAPINVFKPQALSSEEVVHTIDDFIRCAQLAAEAGYDGVEVMGSEGYLINQFIVKRTNHRQDEWGGSYENRIRLPLEIIRGIRKACGPDFIIIYRLSMLDLVDEGSTWEEVVQLAREVESAGATLINSGIGWHEARIPTIATLVPRGAFAWITGRLKKHVRIPLIAVNRINMPDIAEEILSNGLADMVSMARPFLADPELVLKTIENRVQEINTCIACNQACLDHTFEVKLCSCLVNPRACHETVINFQLAKQKKTYLVAGAGPAGMACASYLAEKGHRVKLFEANHEIGGQFNLAKEIPGKEEYSETIRYFKNKLQKFNVEVFTSTAFTWRIFEKHSACDGVVIATGVDPRIPVIEGIDHQKVIHYDELLRGEKEAGAKVAIIGAGGIGFDVATYLLHPSSDPEAELAEFYQTWGIDQQYQNRGALTKQETAGSGRVVYLMQRSGNKPGYRLGKTTGWIHKLYLKKQGIHILSNVIYRKIDDLGIHIQIGEDQQCIDVDNVIICAGQISRNGLYKRLTEANVNCHIIGGAKETRELDAKKAILEAAELAIKL